MGGIADAVGGLAGGLFGTGGADAARKGSHAQQEAIRQAIEQYQQGYNGQNAIWGDQRNIGMNALNQLGGLYGLTGGSQATPSYDANGKLITTPGTAASGAKPDFSAFFNSPDYAYTRDEALKGVNANAAGMGNLFSGARGQALNDRASGLATQNFGNYFNRLSGLAGFGQNANNALSGALQNTTSGIANAQMGIGDAKAGGYIGAANSYGNAAGNWMNLIGNVFGAGGGGSASPGAYGSSSGGSGSGWGR